MRNHLLQRLCSYSTLLVLVQYSRRYSCCTAFATSIAASKKSLIVRGAGDTGDGERVNGEGLKPPPPSPPQQQRRTPQTGWNHNPPSSTSSFWKGPIDEKKLSYSASSSSEPKKEARTGWLHSNNSKNNMNSKSTTKSSAGNASVTEPTGTISTNLARRRLEWAKLQQQRNHRLVSPPTFHACGDDRVVVSTEHYISVPVFRTSFNDDDLTKDNNLENTERMKNERVDVYFCIVETITSEESRQFFRTELANLALSPNQRAIKYVEHSAMQNADDMVLFLQGGPGFGAPTPSVSLGLGKGCGSWADAALHEIGYRRIVLMDQRGTGKSTPITKQTLEQKFPNLFLFDNDDDKTRVEAAVSNTMSPKPDIEKVQNAADEVTEYLSHFRADNIVYDSEFIRDALMAPLSFDDEKSYIESSDPKPWGCSLGQSYGGFCQMTYLSKVEHPPKIMLFTGGIAPILSDAVEVYEKLWYRVKERNLRYYEMYPGDVQIVKVIVQKLLQQPIVLPSGGRLTARRFLSLGISLGGSPSSFASLHELISSAFVGSSLAVFSGNKVNELTFSVAFLKQIEVQQSFDDHPIYFWLHESIYADGSDRSPTNWAADTAYNKLVSSANSEFDYRHTISSNDKPTLFFGEHVFPWMSEDFAGLRGVGLRMVADQLAMKSDWSRLYDEEKIKSTLCDERTRAAAAVYHDDMYVEFDACMKVIARDGPLGKCKVYVTNEYQHSGLRDGGAKLFSKLHGMAKGGTRTPS